MKIKLFTIPNLLTLGNLLCGTLAIVAALDGRDLRLAAVLVAVAAVLDFCDGFAARLLNAYSQIGVQLDSLADMISFGAAPAIAFSALSKTAAWSGPAWAAQVLECVPLLIAAFSALRLAKFNVDDSQHEEFCGLPTPACAIFCMAVCYCAAGEGSVLVPDKGMIALMSAVLSLLLVSPIRMFSFKMRSAGWRGNQVRYIFIALAAVMILLLRAYAIPLIIVLYVGISTVRWIAAARRGEK